MSACRSSRCSSGAPRSRTGRKLPIDEQYVTTYFVLLSFVTMATSSWLTGFLADDIRLGKLSSWMVRPASLLLSFVANNLSEKFLKLFALVPMIGVLWWIFRDSMNIPAGLDRWALFAVSIVLGAILVFTIDILIAALAFWMDDVSALAQARLIIASVLSGAVVPLALMPDWSRGFIDNQPFRYTVSFPVEIVAGDLSGKRSPGGLGRPVRVRRSCSRRSRASSGRPGSARTRRWAHEHVRPTTGRRSTATGCTSSCATSGCGDGSSRRRWSARRTTARTSSPPCSWVSSSSGSASCRSCCCSASPRRCTAGRGPR